MTEFDVALTDYLLTLECFVFVVLLARDSRARGPNRSWLAAFFLTTGTAAALGGTVHGFFPVEGTAIHDVLWPLTLLAIGAAAFSAWCLATGLLFNGRGRRGIRAAAGLQFVLFSGVILFVDDDFRVAVAGYLPAALFLLIVFATRAVRHIGRGAAVAASGVLVTLLAAGLQQLRMGVPPLHLSHNALYHLVQAVGLALVFLGTRRLLVHDGAAHAEPTGAP